MAGQYGAINIPLPEENYLLDSYLVGIGMQEEAATTRFSAQEQRLHSEFLADLDRLEEEAQLQYQQAVEVARIYAGADSDYARAVVQKANIDAQAAIDAANIAAAAKKYDADTQLKIAKMTTGLERQRIAAVELAQPGDWLARVGFFRGQTPEQAKALTQYGGGTVFGGQIPGAAETTTLPRPAYGGYPQGIAGEAGPEVVTATPEGVQIKPIANPRQRLPNLPRFQYGGSMPYPQWGKPLTKPQLPSLNQPTNPATSSWQKQPNWGQQTDTATPAAPAESPVNQLPFLQYARAGGQQAVAPFQAWTGPTTIPAAGITTDVPPPWQYNIVQYQNMSRPEQAMLAATWRGLGMIAGATEEEMIANAYEAMSRSAWTGAQIPAVTQYGSW